MLAGTSAVERSALMREAVRLIIEETLQADVTDAVGRGDYDRADGSERNRSVQINCAYPLIRTMVLRAAPRFPKMEVGFRYRKNFA